jgi:chemotaxis protein CheD
MGVITVGIGDARLSDDSSDVLVTHALGSCIAVAVYDPVASVAGLLHFLLPDSKSSPHRAMTHPCLFADTGIPALFHSAYAQGAQKSRLIVRVVGGAQVLDPQGVFAIGKQNYLACRRILWAAGVLIGAEEVGGTVSRTVRLAVEDGRLEWSTANAPSRELAVRTRSAPAAARPATAQPSPAVRAQVAVRCNEFLRKGGR